MKTFRLTNNQLKFIAMISMLCDHIGLMFLPQFPILRFIGRLAMPIFAYMIAEGCRYTHKKTRYFLQLFLLATGCQLVYYFGMGSVYQGILITFSLSVLMIFSLQQFRQKPGFASGAGVFAAVSATLLLCLILPQVLSHTDYGVDYGIWGALLPVAVYCMPTKPLKLLAAGTLMVLLAIAIGPIQWYALLALPLLALYNGQRGKWKLKYLFYIFYPAHLVILYLIDLLI